MSRDGWIRVEDEMPEEGTAVLVHLQDSYDPVWLGLYDRGQWCYENGDPMLGVTHWQPLPEPPQSRPKAGM